MDALPGRSGQARRLNYSDSLNAPVEDNKQFQAAWRYCWMHMPTGAVYAMIPKNACSTLRYSLSVASGLIGRDTPVQWINLNGEALRPSLRDLVTAPYTFTVLRCPFDRLASVFLDKVVGGHPPAWRAFPTDRGPSDTVLSLDFTRFVKLITQGPRIRADHHWRPQRDFMVYEHFDRYYALEAFGEAAAELKERIGLELIDTRPLIGHDRSALSPEGAPGAYADAVALDLAGMRREGRVPSTASLYTDETKALVEAAYDMDFALYANRTGRAPSI